MNDVIKVAGICGSLRKESFNRKVLHLIINELLPEGMEMKELTFDNLPLYNQDLDLPTVSERPEHVQRFRSELVVADAILIVSPEYNYSIPGGLKNAIDWASRGEDSPLKNKPVSLMGATIGQWGTIRMQTAFQNIFKVLNMKPILQPEILIANVATKFDNNGKFTDETTKKYIRRSLENLKAMTLSVK